MRDEKQEIRTSGCGWDLNDYHPRVCPVCCIVFYVNPVVAERAEKVFCPLGHEVQNGLKSEARFESECIALNQLWIKAETTICSLKGQITKLKKMKVKR